MEPILEYVSAGINQTKKSLDWNWNLDLIAYAASNHIIIYDPKQGCAIDVSDKGHESQINCIQWIFNDNFDGNYLLSTSTNGSAKIWIYENQARQRHQNQIGISLKSIATLKGHNGSVSCGYGLLLPGEKNRFDEMFVVTTADDFCIKGWKLQLQKENEKFSEVFSYKLPGRSLALDLLVIPNIFFAQEKQIWPLVIYAGDDRNVHVMASQDGNNYEHSCCLPGHEDWVTCLAYMIDGNDILLASGSKDGIIRLWKLSYNAGGIDPPTSELLRVKNIMINVPLPGEPHKEFISLSCSLESVLSGHDGYVSCLNWQPKGEGVNRCLSLLSCAKTEDRSVILWEPEVDGTTSGGASELWVEKIRLGEIGGNREGFLNTKMSPHGDLIAATSYQGGLHIWHENESSWTPRSVVSGHFREVVDLDWDKKATYLLSVSRDQTTRLHAQITNPQVKWQEIARPQVHGFDMACVACLDQFKFASGGEEKVVRGFVSTKDFVRRFQEIFSVKITDGIESLDLPETASVPSLGLSNKGGENKTTKILEECEDKITNAVTTLPKGPPNEDELMMGTLWPEASKLYGHGNEIMAMAASHDGVLLASSCRATNELDANIIIWNTKEWCEVSSLSHHRLTVTQLEFSHCDQYLLSVSRDRTWAVFHRATEHGFTLKFHSGLVDKKSQHSRIIWSCAWVPNSLKFLTGSRDKSVAIWHPVYDAEGRPLSWHRASVIQEKDEVMAVAVSRIGQDDGRFLVAIGYVCGSLTLKFIDDSISNVCDSKDVSICHRKSVRRLKFRPKSHFDCNFVHLASAGNDNTVLIHKISF